MSTSVRKMESTKVVESAREGFSKGKTKPIKFREKQLKCLYRFFKDQEENIIKAMYQDMRKTPEEGRLEVIIGKNHVTYLINNLKKFMAPEKVEKRIVDIFDEVYVYNEPYGVILLMVAWNVPVLTMLPIAGAIAAGNTVVIKPSHNTQAFGELLAKYLPQYLDPQCYPVFTGDIRETNELLKEKFDYIYYTGSPSVAKIIHLAANKHLTPTTLELGGKNPVYIDSSVDLKMTARRIMWGKLMNSGQTCVAPDYVLCTKEIEQELIQHSQNVLKEFHGENFYCPIINDYHFKRLIELLRGLKVAIGGCSNPLENAINPTIVVDVDPNHPIMQEEIFGPILPIITSNSVEEAVNFINQKPKPLTVYIFSKKKSVRDYMLENTSSGGVTINDTMMQILVEDLPFGGVGQSGMGLYKGKHSFDTFTHKKSVLHKNVSKTLEKHVNVLRYPPFSKKKTDIVGFLLQSRKGVPLWYFNYILVFLLGFVISYLIFFYWSS